MYGFDSAEDLVGVSPLDLVSPQDRDLVSRLFTEELFQKDLQKVTRFRGQTRDGREIWISAIGMRTEYEGRTAGLVSFRDVTEVKSGEEKMQELYEQEKRLRRKLESEIKRRIEFTRALAHELKTPLTAVLASSSALVANLPEGTALDFARNLERGAHHLNSRIDELLDTAKGEVGLLYLSGRPVDPVDLLRDITDEMSLVFSSRRQSLCMELPSHLPMIWADEGRLRQVLFNLLSNACKYTPEGGKITLKARRKDADLLVEVKDTGTGIAKKEQRKLFEPYQPREIDGKPTGGLGLGLALSKTLVELHGGQIWMRSRKGKGSTCGFSVPLANAAQISFRMWRPEVEMASSRLTKTGRPPKPDRKRSG